MRTIEVNGKTREYRLFVPAGMAGKRLPAFVILHGGYGSAARMENYCGFNSFAAKSGLVAVYPDGVNGHWNDGRVNGQQSSAADISFLRKLIQTLVAEDVADPRQIYLTGISNGGMMALRMACTMPDGIAGIAIVSASQPADATCPSPHPMPAIFFQGTADHVIRFEGGAIGAHGTHGVVQSHADTVSFWRKENGCGASKGRQTIDREPNDAMRVAVEDFPCPPGQGVEDVIIEGGGHTWPGAPQKLVLKRVLERVSQDIDANQMMWKFFESQRPQSAP